MQEPPEFDVSDPDVQRGAERIGHVTPCMLGVALALTLSRLVGILSAPAYVALLGGWTGLCIAVAVLIAYASIAPDADDTS